MLAAWEVLDAVTATRKRLLLAGFAPIPTEGKKPSIPGWQNTFANEAEIDSWFRQYENALNTGVLTKTTPAIDIDILDSDIAEQVEALAWGMTGVRGMVRFGSPPKRAMLFRTDKPFKKLVTPVFISPSGAENKIEILCDGQQVIVFGTHPDTGRLYRWHGGEPGEVARADLPELTEAMAIEFVVNAAAIMRAQDGWTEKRKSVNGGSHFADNGSTSSEFDAIYGDRERKWALAALEGCFDDLAGAGKGRRNNTLNAVAFRLGTMVARHWVSRNEVTRRLLQAATACRLIADDGDAQTRATLESGLRKGLLLPHPDLADETWQPDQASNQPASGFPFEHAKDFGEATIPRWIVKNHIARGEITSWIGQPGSGKSAMLGDLAIHIAAGVDWRGSRLKEKCGVLYFALERHDLVKRRFKVQAKKWGLSLEDLPFAVVKEVIDLMKPNCVDQIVATIKAVDTDWPECRVGMIVIDTSAKAVAAGGGDENSARDTNIAHANLRRIQVSCDVHIALVGHTGKDESKGQRGSNAPRGDVDKEQTFRDGEVIRTKNNDGREGRLFSYRIEAVVIGIDEDGEEISTAIIADDDPAFKTQKRRAQLSKSQRRAMELLDRALVEQGQPAPMSGEIPHGVSTVVSPKIWCSYCVNGNLSVGSAASSVRAFRRAMLELTTLHFIGTWKEWVWIAYD